MQRKFKFSSVKYVFKGLTDGKLKKIVNPNRDLLRYFCLISEGGEMREGLYTIVYVKSSIHIEGRLVKEFFDQISSSRIEGIMNGIFVAYVDIEELQKYYTSGDINDCCNIDGIDFAELMQKIKTIQTGASNQQIVSLSQRDI